jgi:hypothetical protein
MGPADISTTMVYVHYVPQHQAAMRLGQAFEAETLDVSRTMSPTRDN